MELAETNEELFKENKYITKKSYEDGVYVFLEIDDLKETLRKQGLTVSDDLLKGAILDTSGETRDILRYVFIRLSDKKKVEVILKNPILLKEIAVTSYVVANLIKQNPSFMYDFPIDVLVRARKQYVFEVHPPLAREMINSDPTVIDFLKSHVTKELLLELGFHTKFTMEELIADLGDTVGLIALCHGRGNEIITPQCLVTRFMTPWTTCNFHTSNDRIKIFRTIVARRNMLEDEKSLYTPPSIPIRSSLAEQPLVDHMRSLTAGMDSPLIDTFDVQPMLGKEFSDNNPGVDYDGVNFLLIKGKTRTFNLFSLRHEWTLKIVLNILRGKHVVFLDYSCNILHPSLSIPPEQLAKLGGKRKTRRTRRA